MIDGLSFTIDNAQDIKKVVNNNKLQFTAKANIKTGVISGTPQATAQSLRFKLYNSRLAVAGSIHKFANYGKPNNNDFSFNSLCNALNRLQKDFAVSLTAQVHKLEFGVNIEGLNAENIIKNAVSYKGKAFSYIDIYKEDFGKIVATPEYTLKLYNKGKQTGVNDILRIELKYNRARQFKAKINTLKDLTDSNNLEYLGELLKGAINNIIFYDFAQDLKGLKLSPVSLLKFQRYSNPNFWAVFNHKARYKAKTQYKALCNKYGFADYNEILLQAVEQKINYLLLPFDIEGENLNKKDVPNATQKDKKGGRLPHLDKKNKTQLTTLTGGGAEKRKSLYKSPVIINPKTQPKETIYIFDYAGESVQLYFNEIDLPKKWAKKILSVTIVRPNKRNIIYRGLQVKEFINKLKK